MISFEQNFLVALASNAAYVGTREYFGSFRGTNTSKNFKERMFYLIGVSVLKETSSCNEANKKA